MTSRRTAKGLFALLIGISLVATAGCLGGSRNFTPAAGMASQPGGASVGGSTLPDVAPRVGNRAPDFALRSLDGRTIRLSELRGKPVMVNFWASWCPPCRNEMPAFEKAYQRYRSQGMEFLGVDVQEDAETVRKFVQENGYSWLFLLDSDGKVSRSYQVSGVPTTFFIDREGIIRDLQIGELSEAALESKLAKIK